VKRKRSYIETENTDITRNNKEEEKKASLVKKEIE